MLESVLSIVADVGSELERIYTICIILSLQISIYIYVYIYIYINLFSVGLNSHLKFHYTTKLLFCVVFNNIANFPTNFDSKCVKIFLYWP